MQSNPEDTRDTLAAQINELQRPLRGRRALSWLLAFVVLFSCLLLPTAASLWPAEFQQLMGRSASKEAPLVKPMLVEKTGTAQDYQYSMRVPATAHALDTMWDPGRLATPHQKWAQDCKVCHSKPFVKVQDADCLACHKKIGDHVDKKTIALPALHDTRCATCHREHVGDFGLMQQNKLYVGTNCADCHAKIKTSFADTKTEKVSDFAQEHPEFRIQVATDLAGENLVRMRQTAVGSAHAKPTVSGDINANAASRNAISQPSSLKFPHDIHLAKDGIASPKGKVEMSCNNCHQANADKSGFQPVTMKHACQSCHALSFEPAVPNRQVPHGSVDEVLSTLVEFYSYVDKGRIAIDQPAITNPVFSIRPNAKERTQSFVSGPGDARQRATAAATILFEKTSCVVCHSVTRVQEPAKPGTSGAVLPQWKIEPLPALHTWFPKVAFDHRSHTSAKCESCHAAHTSKKTTDVLMPTIAVCRECHVGKEAKMNRITSDCGLCHGFHMGTKHAITADATQPSTALLTKLSQQTVAQGKTP